MAHIVSYSGGTTARNFTLGQTMYNYDYFNRATTTDGNGDPALSTPAADEVLQATLQHVVATYSAVDGRRIYVNGELRREAGPAAGAGLFTDWNDTFALVLGNEVSATTASGRASCAWPRSTTARCRRAQIHAELRRRRRRALLPAVLGRRTSSTCRRAT